MNLDIAEPRRCFICQRVTVSKSQTCACEAVNCCSTECLWQLKAEGSPHVQWCESMKQWMGEAQQLQNLPFTFVNEVTVLGLNHVEMLDWLSSYGICENGYWDYLFLNQSQMNKKFGTRAPTDNPYQLPSESFILSAPPDKSFNAKQQSDAAIISPTCWLDYYNWRGFTMGSPIAALLHYPYTLYYILTNLIPVDFPSFSLSSLSRCFTIHLLGVEWEADLPLLFEELGHLLPDSSFIIHMFGPHVAKKADGKMTQAKRVQIYLHRGLYHEKCVNCDKPDFVLGYNAGLAAYVSWSQTLAYLRDNSIPTYFTDYCRWSVELSRQCIHSAKLGTLSPAIINPFRSPVRILNMEHNLPCYSNAFIFRFISNT